MILSSEVIEAAKSVGAASGVSPAVLLAVALVETNARAFAKVGAGQEPLIRFEGHYFDRLLEGEARRIARTAGLSHPRAGAVRNPHSQGARWALLTRAASIDPSAAYASTSWGLAQVMGSHWKALGYDGPLELAATARASAAGQMEIAARFLKLGALHRLLEAGDHAGFARRYNGPAYARNRYDEKIADALARARRHLGSAVLRRGMRGADVEALQRGLARAGHPVDVDGVFGPATEDALRAFQAQAGLSVDGIAGPRTLGRLVSPEV